MTKQISPGHQRINNPVKTLTSLTTSSLTNSTKLRVEHYLPGNFFNV
ncbi:MAG: hypothetical protein ACN6OP_22130 [Pseudomonadales bacterium]